MILLGKNTTNLPIALTLSELSDLATPYFVLEFQPDLVGSTPVLVQPADISPYPRRYNKFELIDTPVPDPLAGEIDIPTGWGTYRAYEATSPTIDLSQTTGKVLEEGKYYVEQYPIPFIADNITNVYL